VTILIQAHPAHEFERLARAVLDMPISNADDPKERFPKELSRRLFPRNEDTQQQQRLVAAIATDPAIQLNNAKPMPPPPSTQPPQMSNSSSFAERERNPYATSFSSSAVDDDDLNGTTPRAFERERKPYTAKEGKGKTYENASNGVRADNSSSSSNNNPRPTRANSTNPAPGQSFSQSSRPTDIPGPSRNHRMSMGAGGLGARYGTSPAPMPNAYTRSEGNGIADIPAYQYASNMHGNNNNSSNNNGDAHDEPRNPRRYQQRRQTTDEDIARGFGIPQSSRSNGGAGFDQYPAAGSYGSSRGPGGTDGYGSFPSYMPPPPNGPRH